MKVRAGLTAAIVAVVVMGGLTACGSNQAQAATQCFQQLNDQQRQQLEQYAAQNGNTAQTVSTNSDGTQDVCVLEPSGNSYAAHYYTSHDAFGDYMLYAMLTGQGHTLATVGLLTGQLDVGQALALQLLTGINSNGTMYHPYTYANGGWARQTTVINNYHVTNVQYGHGAPISYARAMKSKPPVGYSSARIPKVTTQAATVSRTAGKTTLQPIKKVAGPQNLTNPTKPKGNTYKPPSKSTTKCCSGFKGGGSKIGGGFRK